MGRTAFTEPQCLYSRAIPLLPLWALRPVQSLSACTVELYLYSPYGPYGLYRASVPVQGGQFTLYSSNKAWKSIHDDMAVRQIMAVKGTSTYRGINLDLFSFAERRKNSVIKRFRLVPK
jgi:hypothetical protein